MSSTSDTPVLESVANTARMLGLSTRSVQYLLANGRLPRRKLGRRTLVPRAAVERLARQGVGRITPAPVGGAK